MNNLEYRLRIYTVKDRRVISAALRRLFIRLKTSQIQRIQEGSSMAQNESLVKGE